MESVRRDKVFAGVGLELEAAREAAARGISRQDTAGRRQQFAWSGPQPLNDADKEFFLHLYRSSVAFYQPRIEKQTGVALGEIAVRDYSQVTRDALEELRRRASPWRVGLLRWLVLRRRLRAIRQGLAKASPEHGSKCAAAYFNSAVYVSFAATSAHEDIVATATVHELTHALWERLEGEPLHLKTWGISELTAPEHEKFHVLVEGYACYAQSVWFRGLYPAAVRDTVAHARLEPASPSYQGLRRVRALVKQHGPGILLEIPSRWKDL